MSISYIIDYKTAMPQIREKLDSLQIVRAVAMLLVLFAHIDIFSNAVLESPFLFGIFRLGGGAGVDLFFVLSGFIITFIHGQEIGKKYKSIPYLIKRFTRIYPTYWMVNMIIIPLHFVFPQFGIGDETNPHKIFYSLLLLPDLHAPIIHASWSLSNEVYFYLMFGLLIFIGFKKILPLLIIILIGTFIESFFSLGGIDIFSDPGLKLIFSYYNIEFLLGCLGAYLVTKHRITQRKILLITGITFFLLAVIYEKMWGDVERFRVYVYGIPSFFIITALSSYELNKFLQIPNKLLPKLLIFLGDASFSIYIVHQLLISGIGRTLLASGFTERFGIFITLITITVSTLAIGCIFHLKVEKLLWYFTRAKLLSLYNTRKAIVVKD